MKKSNLLFGLFILGLIVIFLLYIMHVNKNKDKIIKIPKNQIQRIYMVDGNTGEIQNIVDSKINTLYDEINEISLKNEEKVDSTGWRNKIVLCTKEQEISIIINSESCITMNGKRYKIDSRLGEKLLSDMKKMTEEN